jgi:hypothetical protein
MGKQYQPTDSHDQLRVFTVESFVQPAHDKRTLTSAGIDAMFEGGAIDPVLHYRTRHVPASRYYANPVRRRGVWLVESDDGYMSHQVGELRTTTLGSRIGWMSLRKAEVQPANISEATENISAALLFTALERYPAHTRVHVGRKVTLGALGAFTTNGSSAGSINEWLLEKNPWLADGEKL